ncbi:MAG: hypothetical protein KAI75_10225 [Desulfobulbaceae bacterium]|nr:hypothetical protein [Desulfobulbaceae bacterium]MCK5405605.1 hypothetical protein [Desulfobulbaceae bacterium]
MKRKSKVQIEIISEEKVNQAFINAWHRAEKDAIREPEEHLFFLDAATLLRVLSNQRLALLSTLHRLGPSSIRGLSKELQRNYKNVYNDVQILKQAGLIQLTSSKKIFVPCHKICTEIDLAA